MSPPIRLLFQVKSDAGRSEAYFRCGGLLAEHSQKIMKQSIESAVRLAAVGREYALGMTPESGRTF